MYVFAEFYSFLVLAYHDSQPVSSCARSSDDDNDGMDGQTSLCVSCALSSRCTLLRSTTASMDCLRQDKPSGGMAESTDSYPGCNRRDGRP